MTPLQQHDAAMEKPHVMWWVDLAGTKSYTRFRYRELAKKQCRIHNDTGDTWARVDFDPTGEKYPR